MQCHAGFHRYAYPLSWQYHVNDLSIKLNTANALLFKMRKYVGLKILRSIYFAIFDSYLSYCCLVWAQNSSTIQQIIILQKKLLELLIFNQEISIPVPFGIDSWVQSWVSWVEPWLPRKPSS